MNAWRKWIDGKWIDGTKTAAAPSTAAAEMVERIDGNVITLRKPEPITPDLPDLPDLAEYEEVANILGFVPPQIAARKIEVARREVIEFILDKGYPIYSNKDVHAYMANLAEKDDRVFVWARLRGETAHTYADSAGIGSIGFDWQRQMMRQMAFGAMQNIVRTQVHGQITTGYHRPVPLEMLKRAAEIKKRFGAEVEFHVSDYAVVNPDPFIMVKRGECEHIVFGVWDEPGFGV